MCLTLVLSQLDHSGHPIYPFSLLRAVYPFLLGLILGRRRIDGSVVLLRSGVGLRFVSGRRRGA